MTTVGNVTTIFYSCLSLVFIWLIYRYGWREYRIEKVRQDLFALRQELFDFAAKGNVAFDDPVYTGFRNTLNGLIRFSHRITFLRFVLAVIILEFGSPPKHQNHYLQWKEIAEALPGDKKNAIMNIHERMSQEIVWHMISVSPILPLLILLAILVILVSYFLAVFGRTLGLLWLVSVIEVDAVHEQERVLRTQPSHA